ncbi:hypothetical protein BJ170DRAFT_217371 [Xylariales sp. AK1849]|nr:hypothetical protein BJ170DRAFT_217371 [Xylariales sp. AK1849]
MAQPHAIILSGAMTGHHHSQSQSHSLSHSQFQSQSQSQSQSQFHIQPQSQSQSHPQAHPSYGGSSSYPLNSNPNSDPDPTHLRYASASPSLGSATQRGPALNTFHYNRGRSDTTGSLNSGGGSSIQPPGYAEVDQLGTARTPKEVGGDETPSQPPSRFDDTPSSPSFFSPGTLPRTSSLLPPPRGLANANANAASAVHDPLSSYFDPRTVPRPPHSRGDSIGATSDGFRNLNRWSASTTSSRGDYQQPQQQLPRLANFSRRMSVDSVAILAQSTDSHQSPKKLTKRRPSAASITSSSRAASSASLRARQYSPPPPPAPPPNLPPIISLPSLELSTSLTAATRTSSPSLNRPSPAVGTPGSVFSSANGTTESTDYFWDELADPSSSPAAIRGNTPALPLPAPVTPDTNMPEKKGHTRNRSSAAKSSSDSNKTKDRTKQPSQKAMLSKALAKANTAVQLDNAQNYESARSSYTEACDLLQQVLARTTGDEDKKKLEAIRRTYSSRIDELDGMVPVKIQASKALPARPESLPYNGVEVSPADDDDGPDGSSTIETATTARVVGESSPNPQASRPLGTRSSALGPRGYGSSTNLIVDQPQVPLQSSFSSRSPMRRNFEGSLTIPRPDDSQFMPAPLSPRRPVSPAKPASPEPVMRQDFSMPTDRLVGGNAMKGHVRTPSHESISWLDPIDESGGSAPSSVHSRTSSFGVRRKHIRAASGDTEAEFDAALDAAVEAAYDEGYEHMGSFEMTYDDVDNDDDDVIANAMRKVELAKERVRESEREAEIQEARERERQRQFSIDQNRDSRTFKDFYDGNDSDEEDERILEEMTARYVLNNFTLGQQPRQQADTVRGRESDSSGLTQRTWHSSMGSNPPTATTILSTVAEMPTPSTKYTPSSLPPPPQALPQLPPPQSPNAASGVRSRRLSGQNPKQLKIETSKLGQPPAGPPPAIVSAIQPKTGGYIAQQRQALSATTNKPGPFSMRNPGSPARGVSPAPAMAPPTPPQNPPLAEDSDEFRTGSPSSIRVGLRKNQSSSSLKSLKSRQLSITNTDNASDLSPNTPLSYTLTNSSVSRQPIIPALPTPGATTFSSKAMGGFGGLYLFDSDFHSPSLHSPSSMHYHGPDAPMPLEPCPSDVMLRPFWLMRALYQTLAHPRGGYVTSRLFVPGDVWKVKGVKLRALEDKSSQCDLLTAALLKLGRVDSNDADAVLEEMQSLENVLEQVQQTLTRKLGNEVGTQGAGAFRDKDDGEPLPSVPRSASVAGKAGAFSWRRLRSKGSAANLTSAYGGKSSSSGSQGDRTAEKEILGSGAGSLASLPMVAHPSSRPPKRDVTAIIFDGPYAGYMASLARLFDAAQTVDQIARQVEDPGLRHADKTQVGLELCTRHAAEFFGFYICRFVLADLGLLLDKFVKRGSEWVLT